MPGGTPLAEWHGLPIMSDAIAGEEIGEDGGYSFVIELEQEKVKGYYFSKLPNFGWEIDFITTNDKGGFIIYRKEYLDFIFIYEQDGLTHVMIFLSTSSPSRK